MRLPPAGLLAGLLAASGWVGRSAVAPLPRSGKVLRVKVDGGTLTENGRPLPWSPHGYYELALDPGSLTLSP